MASILNNTPFDPNNVLPEMEQPHIDEQGFVQEPANEPQQSPYDEKGNYQKRTSAEEYEIDPLQPEDKGEWRVAMVDPDGILIGKQFKDGSNVLWRMGVGPVAYRPGEEIVFSPTFLDTKAFLQVLCDVSFQLGYRPKDLRWDVEVLKHRLDAIDAASAGSVYTDEIKRLNEVVDSRSRQIRELQDTLADIKAVLGPRNAPEVTIPRGQQKEYTREGLRNRVMGDQRDGGTSGA